MRNVISVTFVFIVLVLSAPRLVGQVKITAIAENLQPVEKSSIVKVIRFGSFKEEDAVAKKGAETMLNAGDEIRCASDKISVELTSNDVTSATLIAPFRAVMLPGIGSDGRFYINLLKGGVQVVSEQPTSIMSGETTLGSRHTRYGVSIERDNQQQLKTEISVYEGVIRIANPRIRPLVVETGKKTVLRKAESQIVQLEKADFKRAATIYATIDTVKSKVARQPSQRKKAYEELEIRYMSVLQEPNNPVNLRNLAVAQINLSVSARALYSLNRAASLQPKPKEVAVVYMLKSIAYNQLGNSIKADSFRKMAVEKDPSINKEENLKLYKIDPLLVPKFKLVQLQPIIVRTLTRPSKIAPKEQTQIIVRATTKDGKPISNADVVISAGGGTFVGTGTTKISGKTDARGNFTAKWWIGSNHARAYGFSVEVSKSGLKKTINEQAKVEIE